MLSDFEKLESKANSPDTTAGRQRVARAVYAAWNDWPTMDSEILNEFVDELKLNVGALTYPNIRLKAKQIDIFTDAWKAEALTELLEAWGPDNWHETLDELLEGWDSGMHQ